MAEVKFTDEEKKLMVVALNSLIRSITVSMGRSGMPLVADAYNKQLVVVRAIMVKVGSL